MDAIINYVKGYSDQIVKVMATHGLRILFIIILFFAIYYLVKFLFRRALKIYMKDIEEGSEKDKRVRTLSRIVFIVVGLVLVITALMMVIAEIGVDIKPVLASLGIGGLAIGFGAQSLVKDIISGFFIILEDQVRVGDVVEAGGRSGLVEKVGLRVLILRDLSGNRIMVPNSSITDVVNMTYEYSRYVFDIGVAYKENVDEVIEVMKKVGDEMQNDPEFGPLINQPLEILGLDKFGDSAVVIKARFETKPIRQWQVGREYNRRLKIAFDEKGIEIPFPHRTIYMGEGETSALGRALTDKSGEAGEN